MVVRFYSSTAAETILSGTINSGATTINVADVTGFPVSFPYTLALDYESASEELVDVTAAAGTSLTIARAVDGTSATSHSAGARVRHVSSGRDHRDSRNHENAEAGVHGVTGDVVGTTDTQTLTNKTLTNATGTLNRVDIFSEGAAWTTTINGDIDNNVSLTQWKRGPVESHEVARISNNGALFIRNQDAAADSVFNSSRIRVVKDDGSTGIFTVLSGGEVNVIEDAGQNGVTVRARADNSSNSAFRVRNAADSATLFAAWQDGRVDISPSNPAFSQLDITAPAGQSASIMRVMNSAESSLVSVNSTGRLLAAVGATVSQAGVLTGTVLQVGGSNTGYVGNLQTWVSPANVVVGTVNQNGFAAFQSRSFTSGATSSSGWSVSAQVMRESAGCTYANVTWTRTGGNITVSSTGNIPDTQMGGVPAIWRAPENIYAHAASGVGSGSARINVDNTVDLLDWTPNRTIVTGEQIRVAWSFIG
ncbi:hypothetical protein SEA_JPANDJE_46 [Streptomyces phage JPandJE]|nr:hypothetical protein SEA_JPANDJE_46 [Streptomyces phage JPandJE]